LLLPLPLGVSVRSTRYSAHQGRHQHTMSRRVGDAAFSRVEKINSELFSLTYGAIVTQLLKDYEETDATNAQLEKMGYNIGVRLIDEFLAKAQVGQCGSFQETAEVISKVGFKMFLGVTAEVSAATASEFCLQLAENPLAEFVELPEQYSSLAYSNMLCGVLRGALEMVQMRVECTLTKDTLWGDEVRELCGGAPTRERRSANPPPLVCEYVSCPALYARAPASRWLLPLTVVPPRGARR
jgi:hypothetical protein